MTFEKIIERTNDDDDDHHHLQQYQQQQWTCSLQQKDLRPAEINVYFQATSK